MSKGHEGLKWETATFSYLRGEKEQKRELSARHPSHLEVCEALPTLPWAQVLLFLLLRPHPRAHPAPLGEERRVGVLPGSAPPAHSFAWSEVGGPGGADVTQGQPASLRPRGERERTADPGPQPGQPRAPPPHSRPAAAMRDPERGWSLSFAGCGFLAVYHIGATRCLSERAPHLLRDAHMFFGSSSGALHCVIFFAGIPLGTSRVAAGAPRPEGAPPGQGRATPKSRRASGGAECGHRHCKVHGQVLRRRRLLRCVLSPGAWARLLLAWEPEAPPHPNPTGAPRLEGCPFAPGLRAWSFGSYREKGERDSGGGGRSWSLPSPLSAGRRWAS